MTSPDPAPKVSVIIPTYNRAALLPRAVNSVLAQTCQDFELLLVDDCSADDTPQVIAAFADPRIRAFRHDVNRGLSAALNTGIANASAEYCAFLDDDDEFTPNSLADRLTALVAAPPEVALVYGWADWINDTTGEVQPGLRPTLEGEAAFEHTLTPGNIVGNGGLLVRASAAKDVGGFDERLQWGSDSYFTCSIISKYRIISLPKVVAYFHEQHSHLRVTEVSNRKTQMDTYLAVHLDGFQAALEQRPHHFAYLLRWKAALSMEHRRMMESLRYSMAAFKQHPFTPTNIRHILRLIEVFIFYVTPLTRFRGQARTIQRALRLRKGS